MTTVSEVFREGFESYAKERRLPYKIYKAANALMNCRTAAMGGHVQQCENGHVVGVQYNSCRHRSCPQCNERSKTQWADAQAARLLACDHYHAIFTVPHELLDLWSYNRQAMADLLFSSACHALMKLLKDERYLGATPGIVATLHTWGRTLIRHPHVHCLVTGGGLAADGQWHSSHTGYLVPVKALKRIYRGKFLGGVESLLEEGQLRLPKDLDMESARRLLGRTARREWNVRIQQRYAYGEGVMRYLGRYVRGGPISNRGLTEVNDTDVAFRYRDHRDGKQKILRLSRDEFIDRLIWHVPEPGRHVTRHYGLYGHKARPKRAICRAHLGQPPEPDRPAPVNWQTYLERMGHEAQTRCNTCGARIHTGPRLPKGSVANPISIGVGGRSGSVQQVVQTARGSAADPPKLWAWTVSHRFFCAAAGPINKHVRLAKGDHNGLI